MISLEIDGKHVEMYFDFSNSINYVYGFYRIRLHRIRQQVEQEIVLMLPKQITDWQHFVSEFTGVISEEIIHCLLDWLPADKNAAATHSLRRDLFLLR